MVQLAECCLPCVSVQYGTRPNWLPVGCILGVFVYTRKDIYICYNLSLSGYTDTQQVKDP